jgi:hypothetical protein
VPDEREQRAITGQVPGSANEPVWSGRVRSGGGWRGPNMSERLLSGFLADGHYQGVPYRPPELSVVVRLLVCVIRRCMGGVHRMPSWMAVQRVRLRGSWGAVSDSQPVM